MATMLPVAIGALPLPAPAEQAIAASAGPAAGKPGAADDTAARLAGRNSAGTGQADTQQQAAASKADLKREGQDSSDDHESAKTPWTRSKSSSKASAAADRQGGSAHAEPFAALFADALLSAAPQQQTASQAAHQAASVVTPAASQPQAVPLQASAPAVASQPQFSIQAQQHDAPSAAVRPQSFFLPTLSQPAQLSAVSTLPPDGIASSDQAALAAARNMAVILNRNQSQSAPAPTHGAAQSMKIAAVSGAAIAPVAAPFFAVESVGIASTPGARIAAAPPDGAAAAFSALRTASASTQASAHAEPSGAEDAEKAHTDPGAVRLPTASSASGSMPVASAEQQQTAAGKVGVAALPFSPAAVGSAMSGQGLLAKLSSTDAAASKMPAAGGKQAARTSQALSSSEARQSASASPYADFRAAAADASVASSHQSRVSDDTGSERNAGAGSDARQRSIEDEAGGGDGSAKSGDIGAASPPSPSAFATAPGGSAAAQTAPGSSAAAAVAQSGIQERIDVARQLADRIGASGSGGALGAGTQARRLTVDIAPQHWGRMQITLTQSPADPSGAAQATATIVTETDAARQALAGQVKELRASLQASGVKLDKIEIVTASPSTAAAPDAVAATVAAFDAGGSSGSAQQQSQGQSQSQQHHSHSAARFEFAAGSSDAGASGSGGWSGQGGGGRSAFSSGGDGDDLIVPRVVHSSGVETMPAGSGIGAAALRRGSPADPGVNMLA